MKNSNPPRTFFCDSAIIYSTVIGDSGDSFVLQTGVIAGAVIWMVVLLVFVAAIICVMCQR